MTETTSTIEPDDEVRLAAAIAFVERASLHAATVGMDDLEEGVRLTLEALDDAEAFAAAFDAEGLHLCARVVRLHVQRDEMLAAFADARNGAH